MTSIQQFYPSDSRCGDCLLKPQRQCVLWWKKLIEPLSSGSKLCQTVTRIVAVIPLIMATIIAFVLGVIGISLRACLSNNSPASSLAVEAKKTEEIQLITEGFNWVQIVSKEKHHQTITSEKVKEIATLHTRKVFISREVPEDYRKQFPLGIVVKLSTREERDNKRCYWPHQEEIAYKIDKLFGWNIVPKTKVLHGSYFKTKVVKDKYFKFRAIIESGHFSCFEEPTFTIQSYRKGDTLDAIDERATKLSTDSYQKAYLLNMIFCKSDSNPGNTSYNVDIGQFTMFDNEFMGINHGNYGYDLDKFLSEKEKVISETLLSQVSSINLTSLVQIRKKYFSKDEELIELWRGEWGGRRTHNQSESGWNQLLIHFHCLKAAIVQLKSRNEQVTLNTLQLEQQEQRKIFQKDIPPGWRYHQDENLKIFELIMKKQEILE